MDPPSQDVMHHVECKGLASVLRNRSFYVRDFVIGSVFRIKLQGGSILKAFSSPQALNPACSQWYAREDHLPLAEC
jgi:hypothetical protein